jgi:Xaa-Pro dipeptidase
MTPQLVTLPFSIDEYQARLDRVRDQMEQRGLDLLLVTIPENSFYLTGFQTGTPYVFLVLVLPREGEATWVVRKTEMSNVEALAEVSWIKSGHGVDDSSDPIEVLARVIEQFGARAGSIGIEHKAFFFTVDHYQRLQRALPHAGLHDASDIIASLRAVKSPAELRYMREAGEITAQATRQAIDSLHEGMLDRELAANLIAAAVRAGSEPFSLGPHVTTGERTFLAHSSWTGVEIRRGDLINTELAAVVARYNAPLFRVSVIGEPSDEVRRFHDASVAGLMAGLDGIQPGMTGAEADSVVRQEIERTGYGEYFVVRAAYGIGLGFPPQWSESNVMQIRQGESRRLQLGMCFHLVPALYKRGLGAVCCSMPIEITGDGVRPLAPIEPRLFVVD